MEKIQEEGSIINTNASASAFGWEFQSNAAILLAIMNIKELVTLKVEGEIEDIELQLNENKNIYVQAKSQVDPFSKSNSLAKLRDGLKTLINASNQSQYERLIYISNIANPLNIQGLESLFGGHFTKYSHTELPIEAQKLIMKYTSTVAQKYNLNSSNINLSKFMLCTFPFFGQDDATRFRIISTFVEQFVTEANGSKTTAKDLLAYWQLLFSQNLSQNVNLSKKELVWPLIVLESRVSLDNSFFGDYDIGQIEEIKRKYSSFIDKKTGHFEFANKVVTDFSTYSKDKKGKSKIIFDRFIEEHWQEYASLIISKLIEEEIKEAVTKLVMHQILRQRFWINDVKKAAGL